MPENDLINQLSTARSEIKNLRQQVRSLQHVQRKEIDAITRKLREFRCEGCAQATKEQQKSDSLNSSMIATTLPSFQPTSSAVPGTVQFHAIGTIRTVFPQKRAVPRQSSVGSRLPGRVELNKAFFTNPEHSLKGLVEYSHLWLIYHFHRNAAHPKPKVAPPRLGGTRVGVFSTRSPHRPCPIGLSLVEIEKVEGANISFFGTDMVDNTPVLDIKPYIPLYDTPMWGIDTGRISIDPTENPNFYDSRQEPDGEESDLEVFLGVGSSARNMINVDNDLNVADIATFNPPNVVRVPNWVMIRHKLKVCFNERAETQLHDLQVQKQSIIDILEADPRSVYLRTNYGSQIFTFQLSEDTVTCKFDDREATVTVLQVRRNENVQDANDEAH